MVLISYTKVGIRRLLKDFGTISCKKYLQVNDAKTKAVVFGTCPLKHKWSLDSQVI